MTSRETLFKWTAYALCAAVLLFLRALLLGELTVWGVLPFLPPVILACVASLEESPSAAVFGIAFGAFCDLVFPAPLPCLYTLAFTVSAVLTAILAKSVIQGGFLRALAGTLLTFILLALLNMLALPARGNLPAMVSLAAREMLVSCLLLVCYPLFAAIRRFFTL